MSRILNGPLRFGIRACSNLAADRWPNLRRPNHAGPNRQGTARRDGEELDRVFSRRRAYGAHRQPGFGPYSDQIGASERAPEKISAALSARDRPRCGAEHTGKTGGVDAAGG